MNKYEGVGGKREGILYGILAAKPRFCVWRAREVVCVGGINDDDDLMDPNNFLKKFVAMQGDGLAVKGEELFRGSRSKARASATG